MNKKKIWALVPVLILTCVLAMMPLTAFAEDGDPIQDENFKYFVSEDAGYALISAYIGKESEVTFPETVGDIPIIGIDSWAFAGCDFVTNITIPDSFNYLGENSINDTAFYQNPANWENGGFYVGHILYDTDKNYAGEFTVKEDTWYITTGSFNNRDKITKLSIPGSVKQIPFKTFTSCDELTDLTIGEGTEVIGATTFANCPKLANISLPTTLKQIQQGVFSGTAFYNDAKNWEGGSLYCGHVLLQADTERTGIIIVRTGTTLMADLAFYECNVSEVWLPTGLKKIPQYAFNGCPNLKTINFNDDIEEFGSVWLPYNDLMTTFKLPGSTIKLDNRAFAFNTFTEITLNENLREIGEEAFVSSENLKELKVPRSVEIIGPHAIGYAAHTTLEGYTLRKVADFVIKGYAGSAAEAYAKENGFEFVDISGPDPQGKNGWYYYISNAAQTGWQQISGKWYYFNEAGERQSGWVYVNDNWYYLDPVTGIMQTGWVKIGDVWYYLSGSGAMVTGWQQIGGTWYFFKPGGIMAANEWCSGYWLNANGSWTYPYRGSWKKNNTGWWFGDTSGWYAKNTSQMIDGELYQFNAAGYWVQ